MPSISSDGLSLSLFELPLVAVFADPSQTQSMFDIVIVGVIQKDYRWVAKKQIKKLPFLGWAAGAIAYFVQRNKNQSDIRVVMKEVEDKVSAGNSVLMFPEACG